MMDDIEAATDVPTALFADERAAVPLAHEAIHQVAEGILRTLPPRRGGTNALLDVPAGEGALAARLLAAGFSVRCCDLYPEIFRLKAVEIKRGDLSGVLPYGDEEFDYITCVEGLEHIENPHQAIREFGRLLRPGGHLIVTIPNISISKNALKVFSSLRISIRLRE